MNFDKRKKDILKVLVNATTALLANTIHRILSQVDSSVTIVSVGRNLGLMSKKGWVVDLTGGIPGTPGQWQITALGMECLGVEAQPRGHAALVNEVKRLKDVIADSDAHHYKAMKELSGQYRALLDRVAELEIGPTTASVLGGRISDLARELTETDKFARTHTHKSSLTTMTYEAKQGGAKQILISL